MRPVVDTFAWYTVLGLTLVAYSLPWLENPGASLTLNAYDLAEWTSLHPAVRASFPPLLLTFALRSLLLFTGILIAFFPSIGCRWLWWLRALSLAGITFVLLPPFEFFGSAFDDPNYRQQFLLSMLLVFFGAAGLSSRFERWQRAIRSSAVTLALAATLVTLLATYSLMREFDLPTQFGLGGPLFAAGYAGLVMQISKRGNVASVTPQIGE